MNTAQRSASSTKTSQLL